MIAPCECRGSIALVHRECLDTWQRVRYDHDISSIHFCEMCGSSFNLGTNTCGCAFRYFYSRLRTLLAILIVKWLIPILGYLIVAYIVLLLHNMPAWPSRALLVRVCTEELVHFLGLLTRIYIFLVAVSNLFAQYERIHTWLLHRAYVPLPITDTGYMPEPVDPAPELRAAHARFRRRYMAAE